MDESRIRASRRRIGFLVAVPLAGAALWAGLAMAATGPTRSVPNRVHPNTPRQQRLHPIVVPHVVHTGHQCPFHDGGGDGASL